jgi:ABC-type phosphate transport system substrate-binding protein
MDFTTKRLRRGVLAAIALAASSGGIGLVAASPAGASSTEITAVGSYTTYPMMKALFPTSINNINPNALTGSAVEHIAADSQTCVPSTTTPPATGDGITFSTALQPPNGSGQGKSALSTGGGSFPGEENAAGPPDQQGCFDLSRSSSPAAPHAESLPSGGAESGDPTGSHLDYYAYALDGVVPLVGSNAGGTSFSPAQVTLAQIQEIYSCWNPTTSTAVNTWADAGIGTNTGTIVRYWPQSGSGTRAVYTDVLGFDPTVGSAFSSPGTLGAAANHCATAPIVSFTNGTTYPNEENTEDGILYNQVTNGVSDANAIYIYSAGLFTQQWNNPAAFNKTTATNRVATGLGASNTAIGNFDPSLTLATMVDAASVAHPYVSFTAGSRGAQGTEALNAATISEKNEWYSHLPQLDSNNPSNSSSVAPGVRYVYNVADTVLPGYNGAKSLIGFDNQSGGTLSTLCHGMDSATIIAQGFLPLNASNANAPSGSDTAGATCREFQGLQFPGQSSTGLHWTTAPNNG